VVCLVHYSGICLEELRSTTKDLGKNTECRGRDSNTVRPEYDSEEPPKRVSMVNQ
jgi:hypothetical protein